MSKAPPTILLVSFYEGGFQPISIGSTAAHLRNVGYEVRVVDDFVTGLRQDMLEGVSYIGVSLQMFQSLQRAAPAIPLLRQAGCPIILFGQHATIATELLLKRRFGDWVIRGDWELPFVHLVERLEHSGGALAGNSFSGAICREGEIGAAYIHRGPLFLAPDRRGLPALSNYHYETAERLLERPGSVVGNVEASRGCHHACSYCSVFAAYGKKVALGPIDVIVQDVRNCVESGAEHICFMDAEFLNSKTHGLNVARAMHGEFPELTFDFTARADHLLDCRRNVEEMVELGARFVTSAFEFPSNNVMRVIDKELEVDQCTRAAEMCKAIGLRLNATFLTFNPWSPLEEVYGLADYLEQTGMEQYIDPLQLETRLLLPKGSPLLGSAALAGVELTEHEFHYEWKHPDARVDESFAKLVKPAAGEFKRCCIKC